MTDFLNQYKETLEILANRGDDCSLEEESRLIRKLDRLWSQLNPVEQAEAEQFSRNLDDQQVSVVESASIFEMGDHISGLVMSDAYISRVMENEEFISSPFMVLASQAHEAERVFAHSHLIHQGFYQLQNFSFEEFNSVVHAQIINHLNVSTFVYGGTHSQDISHEALFWKQLPSTESVSLDLPPLEQCA
jgi:hypothetical protein